MSVPTPAHLQIFVSDEIHGTGFFFSWWLWMERDTRNPFWGISTIIVSVVKAVGVGGLLGAELGSSQRKPD